MNSFLLSNLKMFSQECSGDYKFSSKPFMTRGFISEYKEDATTIAITALQKLLNERVNSIEGADYLQVFEYNHIRFWIIDDIDHITFLLPEEY